MKDYKDWIDDQEVKYTLTVEINDEEVINWDYYSTESLQEEMGKVENVVNRQLEIRHADEQVLEAEYKEGL